MTREVVRTAAALVIGNELLSGKVRDENLGTLAATLRSLGIRLSRAVWVEDDLDVIARTIETWEAAGFDYLVCGWPGPGRGLVEAFAERFLAG